MSEQHSNDSSHQLAGRPVSSTVSRLEEEGEVGADYLEELLDIADLGGDIDIDIDHGRASIAVVASEEGDERELADLVGRDGEVLEAVQELTRLAVQAGSVLKVCLGDNAEQRRKALAALRELETMGIGELRAQGFGRFVVGDPLLSIRDNDGKGFHVKLLHSNDFLSDEK